jgi:RimJ/RimL family protein N-acetyltransferase
MTNVVLRETVDDDLPILFVHQADPEAARMAAFPSRDRDAFQEHWDRIRADDTVITRTIEADGEVVGTIGSFTVEGERDVGYWIGREHWGRGVATAAVRALLKIEPHRPLSARVAAHNVGSQRVLEKCGFRHVGTETADDGIEELVYRVAR